MRNLYSHTKGPKAIGGDWNDGTGNLEPLTGIIPDQFAPLSASDRMDRASKCDGAFPLYQLGTKYPPGQIGNSRIMLSGHDKED